MEPLTISPDKVKKDAMEHLSTLDKNIASKLSFRLYDDTLTTGFQRCPESENPAGVALKEVQQAQKAHANGWKQNGKTLELNSIEGIPMARISLNDKGGLESITLCTPAGKPCYVEAHDTNTGVVLDQLIKSNRGTEYNAHRYGDQKLVETIFVNKNGPSIGERPGHKGEIKMVPDPTALTFTERAAKVYVNVWEGLLGVELYSRK